MAKRTEWWKNPSIMGVLAPKPDISMSVMPPNNPMGVGPAPAGVVAAGEYVMGKETVDRVGAQNLDKLQEAALGRKMKPGGQPIPGALPAYGAMDDGGLVKKGPVMRGYGATNIGGLSGFGGSGSYGLEQKFSSDATKKTVPWYQQTPGQRGALIGSGPATGTTYSGGSLQLINAPDDQMTGGGGTNQIRTAGMGGANTTAGIGVLSDKQNALNKYRAGLGTPIINTPTPPVPPPAVPGSTLTRTPTDVKSVLAKREELNRIQGMKGLSAIASGQSPVFRTLANMAQQQMATQGAMDQASLRQQMAQMGVTGGAANAMMADLQRDIGSQQAQIAGQTATNAQKLAAEATGQLASQGLQGMQFDYNKQSDAINLAMQSGEYDTVAKIAKDVYGMDIDTTKLQNAENANMFSTSMAGLNTLAQDPNFSINTAGASMYLDNMWKATGHEGPMDAKWAADTVSDIKNASDPFYRAMNVVPEARAIQIWGADTINSMGGYKGFQTNMAKFFASGGIKFDQYGNWTTTGLGDKNNPLFAMLNNVTQAAPPTSVTNQMSSSTIGRTFTEGGQTWKQTGWNSTTNQPIYESVDAATAGLVQSSTGTWQYNGENIVDSKGDNVTSYNPNTGIGATSKGAKVIVGDDGTVKNVSSMTDMDISALPPNQVNALMDVPAVVAYAANDVLSGNYTYANSPEVKKYITQNKLAPNHVATTIDPTSNKVSGDTFYDLIENFKPVVISVNGNLYQTMSRTWTDASGGKVNWTLNVKSLTDGTLTSFIGTYTE